MIYKYVLYIECVLFIFTILEFCIQLQMKCKTNYFFLLTLQTILYCPHHAYTCKRIGYWPYDEVILSKILTGHYEQYNVNKNS